MAVPYATTQTCTYTIQVPQQQPVTLVVNEWDVEQDDYMQVRRISPFEKL